jgi:hypothetical protein
MSTRAQVPVGRSRRPVATAPLQRRGSSTCPSGACHQVLTGPGQPLDREVRALLEPRFGVDFSRVRVHTDAAAAGSVQRVSAPVTDDEGREEEGGAGPSTIESSTDEVTAAEEDERFAVQASALGAPRLQLQPRGAGSPPTTCGRPSVRIADYPNTYIDQVNVDLTSPDHHVSLTWAGPNQASGDVGPFHSSPGAGRCDVDCDDAATSTTAGTMCTPKGSGHKVTSNTKCALGGHPDAEYPTYFQRAGIALHSYPQVPNHPASHGCVRLSLGTAQLIQENSINNKSTVNVTGTWARGTKTVKGKPTPVCFS